MPMTVLEWVTRDHPEITASELQRLGAEEYLKGAGKQPNPQIKLSLTRGTVQEDSNSLTQRFEIAGQPRLRKELASSLRDLANQQTVLVSRKVVLEALTAYYQVWIARRDLEIFASLHHLSLQLQWIAERRFAAGQISQDECRQARLVQKTALANLHQAASASLAAEENFRALVGLPATQDLHLPGGPTPPQLARVSLPQKEEILAGLDQLPEIEMAEAKARQAALEAELAGRAGAPDLYLYAYRADYHQVSQQGVQFGISFPLFDWGELGAEHSQKKLLAESRLAEVEASRRSLKAGLLKALELCHGQTRYVELLQGQFEERELLARHSLIAYELGLASLLETVTAQKNYQASLLELAREAVSLENQRLNLHFTIKETL